MSTRRESVDDLLVAGYSEAKKSLDRREILEHLADMELDGVVHEESESSTYTGTHNSFTHSKRRNRISSGTRVWLNSGKQKLKATIVGVDPTTSQVSLRVGHDTIVRKMRDIEPMLKVKILNWDEPGCPVLPEPSYTVSPIRYIASNIYVDVTSKKNSFYKLADGTGWIPQSGDNDSECLPVQTDFYKILNDDLSEADAMERQASLSLSLRPQLTSSSLKNKAVPTSAEDAEREEAAKEVLLEKEASLRFRARNMVGKNVWATFYWQTRLVAVEQFESTGTVNLATLHEINARAHLPRQDSTEVREHLKEKSTYDLYVEDLDTANGVSPHSRGAGRESTGDKSPILSGLHLSYSADYQVGSPATPGVPPRKGSGSAPPPSNEVLLTCVRERSTEFNNLPESKKIEMARIKAQSRTNLAKGLDCFPVSKRTKAASLPTDQRVPADAPSPLSHPSLPCSLSPGIPASVIRDISSSRARGRMQVIEECMDRPASPQRSIKRPPGVRSNGLMQPVAGDFFDMKRGVTKTHQGSGRRPQKQQYTSPRKQPTVPTPPLDPVVRDWLVQHGMAAYIEQFARNKVDAQRLPHLTKDDLIYMELPRSVQFTVAMLLPSPNTQSG